MTEYVDGGFPEIEVLSSDIDAGIGSTYQHTWLHLDNIETYDRQDGPIPHIYTFEHEGRADELQQKVSDLRGDYVFAQAVVWPDELDGVVQDCDDDVLADLEWALVLDPDDPLAVAEHLTD